MSSQVAQVHSRSRRRSPCDVTGKWTATLWNCSPTVEENSQLQPVQSSCQNCLLSGARPPLSRVIKSYVTCFLAAKTVMAMTIKWLPVPFVFAQLIIFFFFFFKDAEHKKVKWAGFSYVDVKLGNLSRAGESYLLSVEYLLNTTVCDL